MGLLGSILLLFVLIFIGYLARLLKIVDESFSKNLSGFILNITLPLYVIKSMNFKFSFEMLSNSLTIVFISVGTYTTFLVLSKLFIRFVKIAEDKKVVYKFSLIFSNVSFMGYPILSVAFGKEAVFYAAIYNISFNFLVYTYGIYLFTKGEKKTSLLKIINPVLVGIIIGFSLFIFSVKLPIFLKNIVDTVGGLTTPLSMTVLGLVLYEADLSSLKSFKPILFSIHKLVLVPTIVFIALKLFGFSGYLLKVPVVLSAMPSALNGAILSLRYNKDYKTISLLIMLTTALSIVTLPLVTWFLK